jgi:hypothetical protein
LKCYVSFFGEMENGMGALGMLNISFLDQWTSFQLKDESYNSRLGCWSKGKRTQLLIFCGHLSHYFKHEALETYESCMDITFLARLNILI